MPIKLIATTIVLSCLALLAPHAAAQAPQRPLHQYETRYYSLFTNVDRDVSNDLTWRLDAMYEEYARRLVEFLPSAGGGKFKVYVFDRKSDYDRFTDGGAPNSAGVTIPVRNIVAAFTEGQRPSNIHKTLQHEAFHQFAYTAIGPSLPLWLNEGLAQVFEEGILTSNRFMIGQVTADRLQQIKQDIDGHRIVAFRDFVGISDREWHENMKDKRRAASQYSQAWAMTHFLVFAADEAGNYRFRSRLIDMLKLVHNGKGGQQAFVESFGDNFDGFQRRFFEYVRTLEVTPEALSIDRQESLADFLVLFNRDRLHIETPAQFRQALISGRYRFTRKSPDGARVEVIDGSAVRALLTDPQGQLLSDDRMSFDPSPSGCPMDDLVCRPLPNLTLRTRFTRKANGDVEHDTCADKK